MPKMPNPFDRETKPRYGGRKTPQGLKPKPKPKPTVRLSIRGPAVAEPTPTAKRQAATSLQRITDSTLNDVIRIVPGQGLPGFEGV